jgi:hypothetical protein
LALLLIPSKILHDFTIARIAELLAVALWFSILAIFGNHQILAIA